MGMLTRKLFQVTAIVLLVLFAPLQDAWAQAPIFRTKRCGKLPEPRQMHGCTVVNSRIYIIGGNNDDGFRNDVISGPIAEDGEIGEWRQEKSIPEYRHYIGTSVEAVNNRIYVIGGGVVPSANSPESALTRARDVLWSEVGSAGYLISWNRSEPFSDSGVSCVGTCSDANHLFILGGNKKEGTSSEVLTCDFSSSGAPINWRKCTPMPVSLWFEGATVQDEKLFVWGGLASRESASASSRCFSATVHANGTLSNWTECEPMPTAIYSSAFCGFNNHLIAVAGRFKNAEVTNDVIFTELKNGKPTEWKQLPTDLETRVYHSLGLDKSRGWIFVTGGRYRYGTGSLTGTVLDTVQGFQIGAP
jgi:hypothetical protein